MIITKNELTSKLEKRFARKTRPSAWARGVHEYALEMVDMMNAQEFPTDLDELKEIFLNGATSWDAYSWSGCSLIYNEDIAARLCTPSELKKCRYGERRPNGREDWLDTQARALGQAFGEIYRAVKYAA